MSHSDPVLEGILGTDQYQLAMAQLYWKESLGERAAQFDYFFRDYPDYGTHKAGYCITAGLGWLLEWMEVARFGKPEIELLDAQRTPEGQRRFDKGFLSWLSENGDFSGIEVRAVPEGRVVHADAPVAVIRGPLAMAQILETPFLNRLNYPTLIATKASRVKEAARDGMVLEFGMRRGPASGVGAGGRAALIGGCDFTSNVALSEVMSLDPKGTHAHSMVQVFMALGEGELGAFRKFARLYPDETILLVDTIDTLDSGVPNAITVFEELRDSGHEPVGIRLDSGDLAYLAIQSALLLDEAGFEETSIVLSSDLDELAIWQIVSQIEAEAPRYGIDGGKLLERLAYGVGTRLITSEGDPSLGGVYKLVAVDDLVGDWEPAIKISEDPAKIPAPGEKKLLRLYDHRGLATADVIALEDEDLRVGETIELHHPRGDLSRSLPPSRVSEIEELLEVVFQDGKRADGRPELETMRERRRRDLERLDPGVRRLVNPHIYHVSFTTAVKELRHHLISEATEE
ncbi:MAG: nicotinate phosphoribosyltransferase [Actinobacteria bacterium]|nr:nicotinate phosphoribosyltransferase [Actinomycetota bacterium]